MDLLNYALSILISLVTGLAGFIIAYKIFDWMTPGVHFSDQLKADNKSVAHFRTPVPSAPRVSYGARTLDQQIMKI